MAMKLSVYEMASAAKKTWLFPKYYSYIIYISVFFKVLLVT